MIMKKVLCILIVFQLLTLSVKSQDVVVLKDGTSIIAKVTEINKEDVKYKKYSNLNGPTYTISKFDVFSINYENGEKEVFSTNTVSNSIKTSNSTKPSKYDIYINDGVISNYNDRTVISKLKKTDKKAKWIYRLLKIHPSSIVGNSDGRLYIHVYQSKESSETEAAMCVTIENTSNEMMYIDLGSSSFRSYKRASTYFVNSSTTTTSSSDGGASVNLGSIASILGVGGVVGTLASGTNVGGGTSSGQSTTVYSERIITVPPHSQYRFDDKDFYKSEYQKPYKTDFKIGDQFKYKCPTNLGESPWEIVISYAMEKDLNQMKKYDTGIYIYEEISVESSWDKCFELMDGFEPIHYYYKVIK